MKRFLVFVIICIVTLSLGLTTYYFLRDNEVIVVNSTYFEVNIGDSFEIDYEHTNPSPTTELTFTSYQPDIVYFSPANNKFYAAAGGKAIIEVSSNKKDFQAVTIEVSVGDGTTNAPFYITSAETLMTIGTNETMTMDKSYVLQEDIDLASYNDGIFIPIGNSAAEGEAFSGTFNFNGHTIYNMNITQEDLPNGVSVSNAGLFSVLELGATVKNLNMETVTITGYFDNAGAIAGLNYGTIERSQVLSGTITNLDTDGSTGGIAGKQTVVSELRPQINRVYTAISVDGAKYAGGIVGYNLGGTVLNCYSSSQVNGDSNAVAGGLVGLNAFGTFETAPYVARLKDCYFDGVVSGTSTHRGIIIGENLNYDDQFDFNTVRGVYYSTEISGEMVAVSNIANESLSPNYGIFNKTLAELQQQANYYSYTDLQDADIYWIFNKVWLISSDTNDGLPYLNMEGPKVDGGFDTIDDGISINNPTDLVNISMTGTYVLRTNLDLIAFTDWTPLGTEAEPFNGKLYIAIDPATDDYYKISNLSITTNNAGSGLFGFIGPEGYVKGLYLYQVNIEGGNNIGAVAGVNNGIIEDCKVINEENEEQTRVLTGRNLTGEFNIGSLVGLSNSSITNCYAQIKIEAQSTNGYQTNAGGLVGYNKGTVDNSYSNSKLFSVNGYSNYIGGIAGNNEGTIELSYFTGNLTGNVTSEQVWVGGLVGYNSISGIVKTSFTDFGRYQSLIVGGIVGTTRGLITECYAGNISIKAEYAGGLAFNIAEGEINNCYSVAYIQGLSSTSRKAGFAYFIEYHQDTYGQLKNCFSATSFDFVGTNYTETYAPVRSEGFLTPRQAGYIYDSIYDDQGQKSTIQGFYGLFNTEFIIPQELRDIPVTTDQAMGEEGLFAIFYEHGFNSEIWNFAIGEYPTLKNVIELQDAE
ncbi:MAG: GLUG motif-containing protein [Spirochaetales bacterium]